MRWIAPELRSLARPIGDLTYDPRNARIHDDRNLLAIQRSLEAHGQQKPIVVREGVVLAGNGTLEAARALGWTHLACVEYRGTEALARAYALADNRTAELAVWDAEELMASLEGLRDHMAATSFTVEDLDRLTREAEKAEEVLRERAGSEDDDRSLDEVGDEDPPAGDTIVRLTPHLNLVMSSLITERELKLSDKICEVVRRTWP